MAESDYLLDHVPAIVKQLGGRGTYKQIIDELRKHRPDASENTIRAFLILLSVNQPSRIHQPQNQKPRIAQHERYDVLFSTSPGEVELYDPERHGVWEIRQEGNHTVVVDPRGNPVRTSGHRDDEVPAGIDAINQHLQVELGQLDRDSVEPVEAEEWLAAAGLLDIHPTRRGKNLRDLLRAGQIAGQERLANGRWVIHRLGNAPPRQAWVVRAGEGNKYADDFESQAKVAIGFHAFGDVSGLTEQEIADRARETLTDKSPPAIRSRASVVRSFAIDIKPGELVLTPTTNREEVLVGRVTGPYQYAPHPAVGTYRHNRSVDWIGRFPRLSLPAETQKTLDTPLSVYRAGGSDELYKMFLEDAWPKPMRAWLFQGNPKAYDVRAAVEELAVDWWTVNQYPRQIKKGHRVYFWEAGPSGGVVGVGETLDDPRQKAFVSNRFVKDPEALQQTKLRVKTGILGAIDPPITREEIKSTDKLAGLQILKFANATNFEVTPEQDAALWKLVQRRWAAQFNFRSILAEVLELQPSWSKDNTPDMERRGLLVRKEGPAILKSMLKRLQRTGVQDFNAEGRDGVGLKTKIPWIRIFSRSRSPSPTEGWYLVYLFAADGGAVYLSLNQGTTVPEGKQLTPRSAEWISERVSAARELLASRLKDERLSLDMDLQDSGALARGYEQAHVVGIRYGAETLPDDEQLLTDLQDMLELVSAVYLDEHSATTGIQGPVEPPVTNPLIELIKRRKNVVFYGPPGTGKTYEALQLAQAWEQTDGHDSVRKITFHPSYGYEDFVQGFRPKKDQPGEFALQSGILLRICDEASKNEDRDFLLIIDEINRGDVARIFGELITYIEADKRGVPFDLAQDETGQYEIPSNLFFLGTMNTADKSVSLLDVALRRRFAFVEFRAEFSAYSDIPEWVENVNGLNLGELLDALNQRLLAEGVEVDRAIGHALLSIRTDAPDPAAALKERIEYDITPLVAEYSYLDRGRIGRILPGLVDGHGRFLSVLTADAVVARLKSLVAGAMPAAPIPAPELTAGLEVEAQQTELEE